jgi:hypothetical protein
LHEDVSWVHRLVRWPYFCIRDLQVGVCRVPMFQGLKVAVYNIKRGPPCIPKAAPDHDLHVIFAIVRLYLVPVPQLVRGPEDLFLSFTPPPLYRVLVAPYVYPLFLCSNTFVFEAPCKSFCRIFLCEKWPASSSPIDDTIILQNLLDFQAIGYPDLLVRIFRIKPYMPYKVSFVCFGIFFGPAGTKL